MITINGRNLTIPPTDKFIGFDGDNKVNTVSFSISDLTLSDFDFKLDVKFANGSIGIIDVVKMVEIDKITLTWEVLKEHITNGILYIQLRAFSGNDEVWHSEIGYLTVGDSINATDYFPSPLPSEFEQMEQRVTQAKNETVAAKDTVVEKAGEVSINTQTVAENTAVVVQSAADTKTSEDNAKASETNAKDSEIAAGEMALQAANNILNGVDNHNNSEASHPSLLSSLAIIEAIARGKANALRFETVLQLNDWIAGLYIRPDGKTIADLNIGDNLYIIDLDVPDYWWDGTQPQKLEAEAVNLIDYYTKIEVDNRLPISIEQSDYDVLVSSGTLIAGRIYYVVPDGTFGV